MSLLRFLLLEDSPLDAELVQATLAEGGIDCELVRVETRADYVAALEQRCFDLILADYSLPSFDGISALEVARTICPDIPFIFVSAVLGEEVAIDMLKSGATDYILKQRLNRLVPSVRRALHEAEERSKRQQAEEALHLQVMRSHILAEVSHALSENLLDFQSVVDTVAQHCAELLGDACAIRLLSEDGQCLNPVAVYHRNSEAQPFVQAVLSSEQRVDEEPYSQVLRTERPLLIPVVNLDQLKMSIRPDLRPFLNRFPIRSLLVVPLRVRGHVIGTIGMVREQPGNPFTAEEQELLQSLAERAALSIENARLYQASQNANRVKDQFLAVLSHELRSPLNPILGWTKLLRSKQLDEATTHQALEIIERNAKLQTQLIEDLLDVSRILRGKLSLNVHAVNLADTIEAALETVQLAASAKSIDIQTSLDRNLEPVSGDAGRLQQVIWNLLSNAVKFTPAGGQVEVTLEKVATKGERRTAEATTEQNLVDSPVRQRQDPSFSPEAAEYAQITVRDTGKGINPELLPHVFDYFWQADSSTTRTFGGLGLGLAIVRHLVELHGGTVWAESLGEGYGATFRVRLPLLKKKSEDTQDKQTQSSMLAAQSAALKGVRVLAVDDDPDMRDLTAFILAQAGAEVTVVASADEALAAFPQINPDVLVADIGMPHKDGYMLLHQIRHLNPQGKQIPAIALTAYAGEADRQQALEAGFQNHLAKPIEPVELIKAVANLS